MRRRRWAHAQTVTASPHPGPPRPQPTPLRRARARTRRQHAPVHARAALAHLLPRPLEPILAALPDEELAVLRTHLDDALFVTVLGHQVPADLLGSAAARAAFVSPLVPPGGVVVGAAALWVHTGRMPPELLTVSCPDGRRSTDSVSVSRSRLPARDLLTLAGVRCSSLARAAVDVARTAPPALAVQAVLLARDAGLGRQDLGMALYGCGGQDRRGRHRAEGILDALLAPGATPRAAARDGSGGLAPGGGGRPPRLEDAVDAPQGGQGVVEVAGRGQLDDEPAGDHPVA